VPVTVISVGRCTVARADLHSSNEASGALSKGVSLVTSAAASGVVPHAAGFGQTVASLLQPKTSTITAKRKPRRMDGVCAIGRTF